MQYKAFLFDLNGTMIDDMVFHNRAWFDILNHQLQANLTWEQVKSHMYGKNQELLVRVFGPERFTPEEMNEISMNKEIAYQREFLPHLKLIHGLESFLQQAAKAGIVMGIGSAAIPFNIDFVLDNLHLRDLFKAIVSADDVSISKPHPETFIKLSSLLGREPSECIVFEDAPKGVEAASNAGMKCIVITTMHEPEEFHAYNNILAFIRDYTDPLLHPFVTTVDSSSSVNR